MANGYLKIVFPDEMTLADRNSTKTFKEALNIIGPQEIADAEIKFGKKVLVSKVKAEIMDKDKPQELNDGFWVLSKSSNKQKLQLINLIIEVLKLKDINATIVEYKK